MRKSLLCGAVALVLGCSSTPVPPPVDGGQVPVIPPGAAFEMFDGVYVYRGGNSWAQSGSQEVLERQVAREIHEAGYPPANALAEEWLLDAEAFAARAE